MALNLGTTQFCGILRFLLTHLTCKNKTRGVYFACYSRERKLLASVKSHIAMNVVEAKPNLTSNKRRKKRSKQVSNVSSRPVENGEVCVLLSLFIVVLTCRNRFFCVSHGGKQNTSRVRCNGQNDELNRFPIHENSYDLFTSSLN